MGSIPLKPTHSTRLPINTSLQSMRLDDLLWCRIASQLGLTKRETIHLGDFIVPHSPVVIRQERSRFASYNSRLVIRTGKSFDSLQRLPYRAYENLDRVSLRPDKHA